MRKFLSAALTAALWSTSIAAFAAGTSYTRFGDATSLGGGVEQLRSDATVPPGYGGLDFAIAEDTTFADLDTLSTDFNVTDDDCAGGSPRYQLNIDTDGDDVADGNIFAYIGPQPSYTGCTPNTWDNSGDLLDAVRFLDTSQLPAGTFYDTYAAALVKYGAFEVVGVQLVVDSSWAFLDGEQTILVRNMIVDGPTSIDQCKNGGWGDFGYKNQGQCVSGVASKNK